MAVLDRHGDRIVVAHERQRGPAAARNMGIRRAAGDIVAFTDADCTVDAAWLQHLVTPLKEPRVGLAGGTIRAREPRNTMTVFGERIHDHRRAIDVFKPPYAITMNWASRGETLLGLGGFDEAFRRSEDVDLACRLQQAGFSLAFVPNAIVYHRNEDTLQGLFGEGFLHGLYAVQAHKRHREFVASHGYRRFDARTYAAIVSNCARAVGGRNQGTAACECVFNLGKKLGKLAGSVRFRFVDL